MSRAERARFRAWVRANHPDAGGDPEAFTTGLAARHETGDRRPGQVIVVVRRRSPPVEAVRRWLYRRRRARRLR